MIALLSRRGFLQAAAGLAILSLTYPSAQARSLQGPATAGLSAEQAAIAAKYRQLVTGSPQNLEALNKKAILELYRAVYEHPVANLNQLAYYDPDGAIGFCFGRDMTAFLLARRMGLQVESMRSLFIIGDLRSTEKPEWRFHVTKLVRMTDGSWIAIDPIVPQMGPLPVQDWINTVRSIWDRQRKAKLYVTPPLHVLPDVRNMAMPDQEKGRDIIELKFNPEGKPGISKATIFAPGEVIDTVYQLTSEAAKAYFLSTNEAAPDAFPFDQLTINGMTFPFRNYFADLMDELIARQHPLKPSLMPQAESFGLQAAPGENPALAMRSRRTQGFTPAPRYGMTFDAEFWRKMRQQRSQKRQ